MPVYARISSAAVRFDEIFMCDFQKNFRSLAIEPGVFVNTLPFT